MLDGALALALPCKLGQSLKIKPATADIYWQSYDEKEQLWFKARFSTLDCNCLQTSDEAIAQRLYSIFNAIKNLNPGFWKETGSVAINTHLEFPREWGLGTSSTLITNLARWAKVNPYVLLDKTFGGSGYDIACAIANGPLLYELDHGRPKIFPSLFNPPFKNNLYFVYLGKKQNSREGIARYRQSNKRSEFADDIASISWRMEVTQQLEEFEALILEHEKLISQTLDLQMVKSIHFADYWGCVKSLGAWGGDFVMVTSKRSEKETRDYFNERGFDTVLKYDDLIL